MNNARALLLHMHTHHYTYYYYCYHYTTATTAAAAAAAAATAPPPPTTTTTTIIIIKTMKTEKVVITHQFEIELNQSKSVSKRLCYLLFIFAYAQIKFHLKEFLQ